MKESVHDGDWQARLKSAGYARFRGRCPDSLVAAARTAIDRDLATNYDPARQTEYDHRSYCPGLRHAPVLMALLLESGVAALLDAAIGFERLAHSMAQIALRRAHNARHLQPPEPHIDGLPTPHNGVPTDMLVENFTVLVGVYLSAVQ